MLSEFSAYLTSKYMIFDRQHLYTCSLLPELTAETKQSRNMSIKHPSFSRSSTELMYVSQCAFSLRKGANYH